MSKESFQIGVVGLAVMGSNLARNLASKDFAVAVYNRTSSVTHKFIDEFGAGLCLSGSDSLEEFVSQLDRPRKIVLMVKAGAPVDIVIEQLTPLLDQGDIIIDGGNALYTDTRRREKELKEKGIFFLGVGISGGEEGALNGPSIMPGGDRSAWQEVSDIFSKIAAQVNDGPCTAYIGPDGAGHFVKMVHNGIEYADMQLLAETYDVLSGPCGKSNEELASIFGDWNEGPLASYLVEITADIFSKKDDQGNGFLLDKILDAAGQKGTGRWTVQAALELGVATPAIAAAVHARILSAMKESRVNLSKLTSQSSAAGSISIDQLFASTEAALYCGKILAYAEGFALMQAASDEYDWCLNLSEVSRIWKGGCIIRATLLDTLQSVYRDSSIPTMLFHPELLAELQEKITHLRNFVSLASQFGVPVPAHANALAYFDMLRSERLPQNLTQAQRDYFGAHTFKRLDKEGIFHADWSTH